MSALLFSGGPILTMDTGTGRAEVLVVEGDEVVAVGGGHLASAYPDAVTVDLEGRSLVPGFIDAHNHLSIAALHPRWADLSAVSTPDGLAARLRDQSRDEPAAAWVRGAGWNETVTGLVFDRHHLDALGLDRPVLVAHYTLHQGVVDSRGLDELGIGRDTPDPVGGTIVRGGSGHPTGLLVERAWSEAHARSLAAYSDPDRWGDHVVARAETLLSDGITAVHDAACAPAAETLYRELARSGRLPISVLCLPHPAALLSPLSPERLEGAPTGEGDAWVRVGPMKLFADGGVEPALEVSADGASFRFGTIFPDLEGEVAQIVERGFRVAVHAIGNLGLDAALGAFASAARSRPDGDHRFRVEHATLASAAQMKEMAALGAVAVVQPGFLHHMGREVEKVSFDGATWMPFGSLARAGVTLAASSDDPCAFHQPVRTSAHGATRVTGSGGVLDPGEAVAYEDWIAAYTRGAAFAGGQEAERGTLGAGKRADMVVLDGALDATPPPSVHQTWVAGRLVYQAGA
jgi:predicted amidohydrolase YtcJ